MKFCSQCGGPISQRIPAGDNRPRHVCEHCATVHYQNPRIVAGCLPVWGEQVLLCRRAIEPRRGFWTLPAGFMENGETLEQAAARGNPGKKPAHAVDNLRCTPSSIFRTSARCTCCFSHSLRDLDFAAGEESLEVRLFQQHEIPWSELAFPTIGRTLECYFADRVQQVFPLRNEAIAPLSATYKKS